MLNEREKKRKEKEEKRFSRVTLASLYVSQREKQILQVSVDNLMLFHVKNR